VLTGMPDLHAATLGSGCVREHEPHLSLGTTGWVSCPLSKKKTDVIRQMATVPGIDPDSYLLGNNQDSAARCLQWFRDGLAGWNGQEPPGYDQILDAAAAVPPGARGVMFTPWLTGERCPVDDADARAGFHHMSVTTTQPDLARAVLEGVAYNTRWMLEAAEHFVGRRLDPLRVVGGGARSDLWCQIVADVCDRTIERVADPLLAGLRGVALGAGLVSGAVRSADLRDLVSIDEVFAPDPSAREVYERAYAEFPKLYKAQRSLFRALAGT
jgi:xylulokinase